MLRNGTSDKFVTSKSGRFELFGRYKLIGVDSNGNNVYRKYSKNDLYYYIYADGNNTHWMVCNNLKCTLYIFLICIRFALLAQINNHNPIF